MTDQNQASNSAERTVVVKYDPFGCGTEYRIKASESTVIRFEPKLDFSGKILVAIVLLVFIQQIITTSIDLFNMFF